MRVHSIKLRAFSLEMKRPLATARGVFTHREGMILGLLDADGQMGFGEASPLGGFSPETLDEVREELRRVALENPFLGASFDDLKSIERWMSDFEGTASVRNAVEQALLDLVARRAGVPLFRLLNPSASPRVETGCLVLDDAVLPDALKGFSVFKLKIGRNPVEREIERITAVANRLPKGAVLRLDGNRSFEFDDAVLLLEACSDLPIDYCEEPLRVEDFEHGAALREVSQIEIALDESLVPEETFKRALSAGLMDVVIIKQMMCGGPLEALRRAELAAAHQVRVCFTTSLESRVGRLGVAHVAAAFSSPYAGVGGLNTGVLFKQEPGCDLDIEAGVLSLSEDPGVGLIRMEGL